MMFFARKPLAIAWKESRGPGVTASAATALLLASSHATFSQSEPVKIPVVREILVRGNAVTKPEVIIREMSLKRGAPAKDDAVLWDRQRIYNLQIFNRVDVDLHDVGDSADVYVTVDERWYIYPYPIFGFRHRDTKKFYYGLGGTHQNLAGMNQKLHVEAATGYDQWVEGTYQNPRFLGSEDLYFRVQTSYAHLHPLGVDGSEYQQISGTAKVSVGFRNGYYQNLVVTAGLEGLQAPNGRVQRTASGSGKDVFLTAVATFTDDRRNLREYPTDGSFAWAWIAKDGFGESQTNLLRAGADMRLYGPLWSDWSFALRVFGRGVTGGVVPTYRHVFYGYDERLRGSFRTVREGELQVGGNAEVRVPIFEPRYYEARFIPMRQFSVLRYGLYAGVFADAGKLWYRSQSLQSAPLFSGTGAGLHFILPYGLVLRTEYAFDRTGRSEFFLDVGASF